MNINVYLHNVYKQVYDFKNSRGGLTITDSRTLGLNDEEFKRYKSILSENAEVWGNALRNVADTNVFCQTIAIFNSCGGKIDRKYDFDEIIKTIDLFVKVLNKFLEDGNTEIDFNTL